MKVCLDKTKKSAPGKDSIHYDMLKHLADCVMAYLVRIYNKIWREATYPNTWTDSVLLPFLKPGKSPSNPGSYRPIVLTSFMGKLLEKVVNVRLMHFLVAQNGITQVQYGFRK